MIAQPLDILPRHFKWTISTLLDHAETLSSEQYHHQFPIGLGSLHDTLRHMIQCVRSWVARIEGRKSTPAPKHLSIAEMRALLDVAYDEIAALIKARESNLDAVSSERFEENGTTVVVRFTAGAAITHCLVHTSYHAAQCVNMLRHLNTGQKLPELDVMDFFVSTEPESETKEQ